MLNIDSDQQKILLIKTLLAKMGLKLDDLTDYQNQFKEYPLILTADSDHFKKAFKIRNKTDYSQNPAKLIHKICHRAK